jgi:DNA-binding Lrp family transcriptional regulator
MNRYLLTQRDLAILAEIELADDISPSAIARRLKLRVHTVQHSLAKLRAGNVFTRGAFIDIHRLGMRWCGIFMSLHGDSSQMERATHFIASHSSVGWFAELHGSFSVGVAMAVSNPKQADTFLKELIDACDVGLYKKSVAFRLCLLDCSRQYLSERSVKRSTHYIEDGATPASIDAVDVRILEALAGLPEASTRDLGSKLGMPHTTVDLRLRKLREKRILLGHSIHIAPERLGRQLYKVLMYTRAKSEKISLRARAFAIDHPLVSHFVESIGGWDFEFNIEVANLTQLREFESQLRREFEPAIDDIVSLGISKVHVLRRFVARSVP